ncbi:MAG: 1-acyl-sn-glycerol-3-phosphate acyltransferase [Cyclobacteriaceae bacterium]|nr:1-acyl-sn-glycerol-3-phosphate acyltransferase [Cyclobacteriaceae bacterium]
MLKLKKSRANVYEPTLPGPENWPVVRLSRNRKEFIEEVIQESYHRIKQLRNTPEILQEEIEITMFRERLRIKENPWKVDPDDEMLFWNGVKNTLVGSLRKSKSKRNAVSEELLLDIISRYTNEIAGNFKPSHYRMARSLVTFGFSRLFNAARLKSFKGFFKGKLTLQDKINIVGENEHVRKLAKIGTIVMVPTHFSNLDSITIGFVIHTLGLPPFIYGAGLNLFNISVIAYFMNSLGAYKVDRRKKNMIYLETLKMYSNLALQKGCHSLFFPGGTRSRSGKLESRLKLGLLSTAMEAQRINFLKAGDVKPRKIFVVPVVLNYNFVLEAVGMISDYLSQKGQERYYIEADQFSSSFKILKFLFQFFTRSADMSVSVGRGMDLLGNYVDDEGNSLDRHGNIIQIEDYFKIHGRISENPQREGEYTRMLSDKLVSEYHKLSRCSASQLAAFTAFEQFRNMYKKLDLYGLLRLPIEDLIITYEDYKSEYKRRIEQIFGLEKNGKIQVANHLREKGLEELIEMGIKNVGIFHTKRPLLFNKEGNITTQDLKTLYYYRNRLDGYGLEKN